MSNETGFKAYFGVELAALLSGKISHVWPDLDVDAYQADLTADTLQPLALLERVALHAQALRRHLPEDYPEALGVLTQTFGEANPNETGMFTHWYWLWPTGTFISTYGLHHYDLSIAAIEELTKRHTGEYAIRPFIVDRPDTTLQIMKNWAKSEDFHVRRLASEGLRPRLPWSKRLRLFVDDPSAVFAVLELLRDDPSRFVQRSVANNLNDYTKDNRAAAMQLLTRWSDDPTPQRRWIIRHALRTERKRGADDANALFARIDGR